MAGKQRNKKAAKRKPSEPAPCAVLWGLAPDSGRGAAVRDVLRDMGVLARTAAPEGLNDPAGAFAHLPGLRRNPLPYAGKLPDCEFVLLCGLSSGQVDDFVARCAEAGCQVGAKAVLTKANRGWPLVRLIEAVQAEHEANS